MAEILLVEDEECVNRGIEFLDIIRDHNYSLKMPESGTGLRHLYLQFHGYYHCFIKTDTIENKMNLSG